MFSLVQILFSLGEEQIQAVSERYPGSERQLITFPGDNSQNSEILNRGSRGPVKQELSKYLLHERLQTLVMLSALTLLRLHPLIHGMQKNQLH